VCHPAFEKTKRRKVYASFGLKSSIFGQIDILAEYIGSKSMKIQSKDVCIKRSRISAIYDYEQKQ
jgi:hypothetical protein